MKINKFGEVILNESEIIRGLYSGKITDLSSVNVDDPNIIEKFNYGRSDNADFFSDLHLYSEQNISVEEFDLANQNHWLIPNEYKEMDIELFILEQCRTEIEVNRVVEELELFRQHRMVNVLKYLKYLVDTMRSKEVVWGVGRGSSLASYSLFLLGVHKIDSIKYQLDIREFLK
jgi:DNA polymerase III alpha subunit